MNRRICSVIVGSGSYIPEIIVKNSDFLSSEFYDSDGILSEKVNDDTIEKFRQITDIEERRYVSDDLNASDIGFFAAREALNTSSIDKESLDYIIVAHNFGDVRAGNRRSDLVPSLASRIKFKLGINNPFTVAYDLPFGCAGWLQGFIHAHYFIRAGDIKRAMIIGAETLSRICDPHDRDSMIYSDGAGAIILESREYDEPVGVLAHKTRTDSINHAFMLWMDKSFNPNYGSNDLFLKMNGRKLYEYALMTVPQLIKDSIDKAGLGLQNIKKILIHQANAKMDEAMLSRLFKLYHQKHIPDDIMPMTINKLGNNSVATLPILYDLIKKGKLDEAQCEQGDCIVFASVGAGMNVNSLVYKVA